VVGESQTTALQSFATRQDVAGRVLRRMEVALLVGEDEQDVIRSVSCRPRCGLGTLGDRRRRGLAPQRTHAASQGCYPQTNGCGCRCCKKLAS
jgi:hypothetical protein